MRPATHEPISWLRLEQCAAGELSASENAALLAAVAADPVDTALWTRLQTEATRPLPPLRLPARRAPWAWRGPVFGLAAAASVAALLWVMPTLLESLPPEQGLPSKGGEVSAVLVREREGQIVEEPAQVRPSDRLKLLLSCVMAKPVYWQLVVEQAGERFVPLTGLEPIACQNNLTLPGAFRLTSLGPARVCLLLADQPLPAQPTDLPAAWCVALEVVVQ